MKQVRNAKKATNNFIKEIIDIGVDIKEAAEIFGVTESTISSWKNGANDIPLIYEKYFQEKYGNVLNLEYDHLMSRLLSIGVKLYKIDPTKTQNNILDMIEKRKTDPIAPKTLAARPKRKA